MSEIGAEARRFARHHNSGVLSTLSRRIEGFPFGSVAPFVLDHAGRPLILISEIAEHTRNIDADPRVSLIVQPFSPDMQVTGRVTVLGHAERLPDKAALGARYLRYFPQAEGYFAMHDFHLYRIEPVKVRWIGGFGRIHWVEPEAWRCDAGELDAADADILAHMNADHRDTLRAYAAKARGSEAETAEMIGIDPDGFDLRTDAGTVRIEFEAPVRDAESARAALLALARQARA